MAANENEATDTETPYLQTDAIDAVHLPRAAESLQFPAVNQSHEADSYLAKKLQEDKSQRQTADWAALLAYRTPLQEHSLACDGKAAAVLTTLGIMFTIVARYSAVIGQSFERDPILGKVLLTLVSAFGVLGVLSVVQSFRTIIPRFPPAPRSLAFFGDILRLTRTEYIAEVEAMDDEEALKHMLNFNHTLSLIVVDKFAHVNLCLRLFEFASFAWLGAVLVLTVRAVAFG